MDSTVPLRTLQWIEAIAFVSAFVLDSVLVVAIINPYPYMINPFPTLLVAATTIICAAAVFAIPHSPNNRRLAVIIAIVGLAVIAYFPPYGVTFLILGGILAIRLTFASGISGTVLGGITIAGLLILRVIGQMNGSRDLYLVQLAIDSVANYIILLTLLFGTIWYCAHLISQLRNQAKLTDELATQRERSRIALELHDALGHSLTTLNIQLQNAQRLRERETAKADTYLGSAIATAQSLLDDVRESVAVLRTSTHDPLLLRAQFERLFLAFSNTTNGALDWSISVDAADRACDYTALYRVAQEALTNVARHAHATRIHATLTEFEDMLLLSIEDNGVGFNRESSSGTGLCSMLERVDAVGGVLEIDPRPAQGTRVVAKVPRKKTP